MVLTHTTAMSYNLFDKKGEIDTHYSIKHVFLGGVILKKNCVECEKPRNVNDLIPVYNSGKAPEQYICKSCLKASYDYGECDWCKGEGKPRLAYEMSTLTEEDDGSLSCPDHSGSGHQLTEDEQDVIEYINK